MDRTSIYKCPYCGIPKWHMFTYMENVKHGDVIRHVHGSIPFLSCFHFSTEPKKDSGMVEVIEEWNTLVSKEVEKQGLNINDYNNKNIELF